MMEELLFLKVFHIIYFTDIYYFINVKIIALNGN